MQDTCFGRVILVGEMAGIGGEIGNAVSDI
jgi:hypothetical protein